MIIIILLLLLSLLLLYVFRFVVSGIEAVDRRRAGVPACRAVSTWGLVGYDFNSYDFKQANIFRKKGFLK